jgi:L-fuconolactonase
LLFCGQKLVSLTDSDCRQGLILYMKVDGVSGSFRRSRAIFPPSERPLSRSGTKGAIGAFAGGSCFAEGNNLLMTRPRRIDAHVHFWTLARDDYGWMTPDLKALYRDFSPEDLSPHIAAAQITEVIAVQAAATVAETEFLLELTESAGFVSGVIGWANMEAPDFAQSLDRLCRNPRFKGVRPMIQDIADPDWMLGENLRTAFRELADRRLCFEFLVRPSHLRSVLEILNRHPDLQAVIDHGAKPKVAEGLFDEWAALMARIADQTSAYCKLSGLVTEAGPGSSIATLRRYVDHLVDGFGSKRLIFGSDWPVLTMAASYADWHSQACLLLADLNEGEREEIFGGNAARFYGV